MTTEEAAPPADGPVLLPGHLVVAAKDWSDGKTAKELAQELYVRWIQLATVCLRLAALHGQDLDGEAIPVEGRHPVPTPDELRQWLAQLVPPGSGTPPPPAV